MTAEEKARPVEIQMLQVNAGDDAVAEVTDLVNRVYARVEEGLWHDGASRTTLAEVSALIRDREIAVARLDGWIVGCVRIQQLGDGIGEFGMLAVDPGRQSTGIGRRLVRFAERLSEDRGLHAMQLELLVPKNWTHPSKQFLHDWYTRIGYRVVRAGSIDQHYPTLAPCSRHRAISSLCLETRAFGDIALLGVDFSPYFAGDRVAELKVPNRPGDEWRVPVFSSADAPSWRAGSTPSPRRGRSPRCSTHRREWT